MDYKDFFKNKKITVIGLGLLGRGIGDVRFLAEMGADVTVTDLKTTEQLKESLDALRAYSNIRYTLGRHDLADFRDRDLILNGASVPLDSPYIAEARKNGIPVSMSTALFSRFARAMGATIIGVTGTRGKTTTTFLIAAIMRAAGNHVILGGNVQGVSTLALLPELRANSVVVLELDSWQLQGFRDERMSPHVAVFTTFYPDHLNYYKGDMHAYLADKAEIFLHQKPQDTLVLGTQCADAIRAEYDSRIMSAVTLARGATIADWKLRIPGEHNRENVACAIAAARALHVDERIIKKTCEEFTSVEGRLQPLRTVHGITVYNDTTATTPEATIAGLEALDAHRKKNVVLIMGGADKKLDMTALIPAIAAHCKKVIFLAGSGTEQFRLVALHSPLIASAPIHNSLTSALADAVASAHTGDTILFSPSYASFGMFTNEYDRGAQFTRAVEALQE